jgi:hypothetical protein
MKNPFHKRKLHFSGRNLMGFRPIFFKKPAKKSGGDLFAAAYPPEGSSAFTATERNKQIRVRIRSGRASLLRCNSSTYMENINGRRIAAHSQAHYWLDQATPVHLKKNPLKKQVL